MRVKKAAVFVRVLDQSASLLMPTSPITRFTSRAMQALVVVKDAFVARCVGAVRALAKAGFGDKNQAR